jgi:hypothetical protein
VPARPGTQHETHWYYERSRGQYTNETFKSTAAERRRFEEAYPKHQVFSKTDLAKSEMSWRQLPHTVSLGAQKNFLKFASLIGSEWSAHEENFHEEYFRTVVARVILFRGLEKLVSKQPWYSGGYRANVVYYTMAKLAQMIEKDGAGRYLDTQSIWRTQTLTAALEEQLRVVAREMHDVITDPPAGIKNVTEWAKRPDCWTTAAAVKIPLNDALKSELLAAGQVRDAHKDAVRQERMDEGIVAQAAVLALGPEYWAWLRDWGRSRNYLSQRDEGILRVATSIPASFPTELQSKALLELKRRFELEGLEPRAIPE